MTLRHHGVKVEINTFNPCHAELLTIALGDPGLDLLRVGDNDTPMSVFTAELPAGTYVFGSMDSGKNFYSIGAVPQ